MEGDEKDDQDSAVLVEARRVVGTLDTEVDLEHDRADTIVSTLKAFGGAIPGVGSLVAEVISLTIPNQRIDRLTAFVKILSRKLEEVKVERLKDRIAQPGFVGLLEEGIWTAARASCEDRLEYIAALMKNSVTKEDAKTIEFLSLLRMLNELNEIEVLLLRSMAKHASEDAEFYERHGQAIEPKVAFAHMGQGEIDEATVFSSYWAHLYRLGLMRHHFRSRKKGEFPEFDPTTGAFKPDGRDITVLGRLLLRSIDLLAED